MNQVDKHVQGAKSNFKLYINDLALHRNLMIVKVK